MPSRRLGRFTAILVCAYLPCAAQWLRAEPAATQPVCGELTHVGEIRILRVWGTAEQRGYAHGWLLAEDIKKLFESFLADTRFSGGVKAYSELSRPMAESMMTARPAYRQEMEGIVAGIRDRLGDRATIGGLDRPIEYGDILAVNCMSDRVGPMCSSFSVWGKLTKDGGTLTARNLDWPRHSWMIGADVLLVELPSDTRKRKGWATLTWPGFVGCLSGMNESGVTVAMHDVPVGRPEGLMGFTPRGFALREAMEKTSGSRAIDQIAELFRQRHIAVGTNIFVSMPWGGKGSGPAAAVMEYDGRSSDDGGVTLREPETSGADSGACYLACTNHFRDRGKAVEGGARMCARYATLRGELLKAQSGGEQLDVDDVWRIAASVNVPGTGGAMLTYHTIVFEPDKGIMHLATATDSLPAGRRKPVSIDLRELLRAPVKAAASSGR